MGIVSESSSGPELLIIAGPNGAGKTTFVNTYLPEFTNVREFVNADLIARGISPFDPDAALLEAGRVVLSRIHQLIDERASFALETTLSGRGYAKLISQAQSTGYSVTLDYLNLNSVELSLERIIRRVKAGGHNVPEEIVRRRFDRSLVNFFQLYRDLADHWEFWDNSASEYQLWASGTKSETLIREEHLYNQVYERYGRGDRNPA
ncbi:MAG TPA: zeta toxin family protein [Candidatus Kapabacteria bacterium]|nr:zeta toxin family protein [Candidatus Kapabacteria bacterium]